MKRRHLIFAALVVGVVFSSIAALSAQGALPVSRVMAVDSEGRVIGEVLRTDFSLRQLQVALQVEEQLVIVMLRKDSFSHGARPNVYFGSSDCSGEAYISANVQSPPFGAPAAVAGKDATLYLGEEGSDRLVQVRSMLREDICRPFTAELLVLSARPVLDLASEFVAPFEIVSEDSRSAVRGPRSKVD